MKTMNLFLILFVITGLSFSCKKDKTDDETESGKGILLEIASNQNTYVAANGARFYTDALLSKNDTNLYRLKVNKGSKYHIFCIQPDVLYSGLKMILYNSKMEVISDTIQYNGKPELFFTPGVTGDIYLSVFTPKSYNESLSYNLYFELCKPIALNFMNYNWKYMGDWKVVNSKTLSFKSSDSREFRWIRLNSVVSDQMKLSFTLKSAVKTDLPSFGIVYKGSPDMMNWGDYQEELPAKGEFINISDYENYRILHLNGTSIAFEYGSITMPKPDLKNGVSIAVTSGQYTYTVYMNNVPAGYIRSNILNTFYLLIEDIGSDQITIENLKLE